MRSFLNYATMLLINSLARPSFLAVTQHEGYNHAAKMEILASPIRLAGTKKRTSPTNMVVQTARMQTNRTALESAN